MDNGWFDIVIVIAHVDSEAWQNSGRRKGMDNRQFSSDARNWDLYIAFLELGYNLLAPGGYLSFITPDK